MQQFGPSKESFSKALLVAGLDIGTTTSGWSYLFICDFAVNPTGVETKIWRSNHKISSKAPTCVLIEPDGKTFSAFGYDAENRYSILVEEGEHIKWYFFRRFKMKLYNEDITRDMDIEDETGKKLNAKLVFMATIRFLKDDLLKCIEDRIKECVKPEDIRWVLTVPAIWDDGAKQFMREAAESAGISSDQLIIALEPEAAAICCRFEPVKQKGNYDSLSKFKTGCKVMVVDAGGNEVVEEFKRNNTEDYKYMMHEFELKRRAVDLSISDQQIIFRIPSALLVKCIRGKNIQEASIQRNTIKVNVSEVAILLKTQVDGIVDHVSNLIDQSTIDGIAAICLVGGFSNCSFFQQAMKTKFHNHTIIVPDDPDLAVLIGAVIFGHTADQISKRGSNYTYGVEIRVPFIEHVHRESYKVRNDHGDFHCQHVFGKHITAGQSPFDEVTTGLFPATSSQNTVCLSVYCTLDPDPMYVTDEGCHMAGRLEVPLEGTGTDRCVMVRMIHLWNEIEVEATEVATGTVHRLSI
ncbi:heat shock 70 kDa protein 12A-like [Mya arenaria]|uniref:heat shock 70 kDa protein 12A-like n=1 Tax=Mya arenaria TaxID=6604 RepID=UPI0022E754FD|nr:heat shock 70 kDa protein 12A-like [Mya arenaria]